MFCITLNTLTKRKAVSSPSERRLFRNMSCKELRGLIVPQAASSVNEFRARLTEVSLDRP